MMFWWDFGRWLAGHLNIGLMDKSISRWIDDEQYFVVANLKKKNNQMQPSPIIEE